MDLRERSPALVRHPWEVSRARFFRRLIAAHAPSSPGVVLDVGSGDSWFATQLLEDLPAGTRIECWDINYSADDLAEPLDRRLHRTATTPEGQYGLVLALDVLEHIEHDAEFVAEHLAALVEPGGTLVASVPAHQWLFTAHDESLHHHRRYSKRSFTALLSPSFTIVSTGSLFTTLLLPRTLTNLVERLQRPAAPEAVSGPRWEHGDLITRATTRVLDADARLHFALANSPMRLPGLSVWAVCTKPLPRV